MDLQSGLIGNAYYYPWVDYDKTTQSGDNNNELYTTDAYLSGGYIDDNQIIGEDHDIYTEPNVIARDVTVSALYFYNNSTGCAAAGACDGE